ncbi:MAG: DUF3871 family protein [Bacteroidales bacterium]|nr:DUF3871 family protein [Bacteroidales bacterium]
MNNDTNTLELETQQHPNFIESNTQAMSLAEIADKCIVPTFSDNSLTISHQDFCGAVYKAAENVFGALTPIECRVSHPINGRIPTALNKKTQDLADNEKTIYYQRLAWIAKVANLTKNINGQEIHLTIGGVRAYSEDKLYNRPSALKFKIFVGWQVRVCSNLMLQTDGFSGSIDCITQADIHQKALELFNRYDSVKDSNLEALAELQDTRMTEEQFCHILGRLRLYQALPLAQQREIPQVILGDQAINEATRQYVSNPNFGRKTGDDGISTWDFMQLLTEAAKGSYIDRWLDRNANCIEFATGIRKALRYEDSGYDWFLN